MIIIIITSQRDNKSVTKSEGHRARFYVRMLTKTAIYGPSAKTARNPKLDK